MAGVVVVSLLLYAYFTIPWYGIFKKAGEPTWPAFVPVVQTYFWLRVISRPWWYLLLLFIPLVNIITLWTMFEDLARSFGKGKFFALCLILSTFLWVYPLLLLVLAFGPSAFVGRDGLATSQSETRQSALPAQIATSTPVAPPVTTQLTRTRASEPLSALSPLVVILFFVTALSLAGGAAAIAYGIGASHRDDSQSQTASPTVPSILPSPTKSPAVHKTEARGIRVAGRFYYESAYATIKESNFGFKVCTGGTDAEARVTRYARLWFSSDQRGTHAIGATRVTGKPALVRSRVDGQSICAWEVHFATRLPSGTHAFYVHYGYNTDIYWGPYSLEEASNIGLVWTH